MKKVNFDGAWGESALVLADNDEKGRSMILGILPRLGDARWQAAAIMHDMGMSGRQLWFAYKNFADRSLHTLVTALEERSQELVDVVNHCSREAGLEATAVQRGNAPQLMARFT